MSLQARSGARPRPTERPVIPGLSRNLVDDLPLSVLPENWREILQQHQAAQHGTKEGEKVDEHAAQQVPASCSGPPLRETDGPASAARVRNKAYICTHQKAVHR